MITPAVEEAAVTVRTVKEPVLNMKIHLTSPVVRERVECGRAKGTHTRIHTHKYRHTQIQTHPIFRSLMTLAGVRVKKKKKKIN